jgi:DNA-binding transcriptional regulator YiaG
MTATKALAEERLARLLDPEPCDVESLRTWFHMTQSEVAAALGRSPRTVARWKAVGTAEPTRASAELARSVRKLGRVKFLLDDLMPHDHALRWLQAPNPGFRGEAPVDLLMCGRADDVIAVLEALADGGAY